MEKNLICFANNMLHALTYHCKRKKNYISSTTIYSINKLAFHSWTFFVIAEIRGGSEFPMVSGFSSLHWCDPSWYLQFEARIQFLLVFFPRHTNTGSEAELYLPDCWILLLSVWSGPGTIQSVLRHGCHRHHFLLFEDLTEKEYGKGRSLFC